MWFCGCLFIFLIFKIDVFGLQRDIHFVHNNGLKGNERTNKVYYRYISDLNPPKINSVESEKVTIQVYYESLCPACINLFTTKLAPVVKKLGTHLNIFTYPYGHTKIIRRNEGYQFESQHGPEECYGNKLHACAIDILRNNTQAVLFNACMMVPRNDKHGSTDEAADICGVEQNVDSALIKQCAKSSRGIELLKYYGDESKNANFALVPYILVNGKVCDRNYLINEVCAAFTNPPDECREMIDSYVAIS